MYFPVVCAVQRAMMEDRLKSPGRSVLVGAGFEFGCCLKLIGLIGERAELRES